MGYHFRCGADTNGRLSLGAEIVKKVELWLCDNFCKSIKQTVFGIYFRMRFVIKLIVICFKNKI